MSFPLQQGGYGGNTGNGRGGSNNNMNGDSSGPGKKAHMNPSSIDAMFQGILPAANTASPANPRQLSGLNNAMSVNLGSMSSATSGGMVPSARLSQAAAMSHHQHHANSLNSNLGEEIKRLQQLHQLTSSVASAPSSAGHSSASANQLMQGLLAGRNGASGMSSLGGVKNPAVAAHQASMLQSLNLNANQQSNVNQASALQSLSQRDAAFLIMSQQQQQQQQHHAALQQQHHQQQQQALQQQLAGGGLLSPSAAAQLIAVSASQQQLLPSPSMLASRAATTGMMGGRPGPGAIEPFPEKLHRMLTEVELRGKGHIISFVDEGRAFAIHKPNQFFKEIVPLYFRQSRLSSFKRQLNLYGFELISNGPSRGAYYHDLFQRDKPNLCRRMRRVAVKVAAKKQEEEEETIVKEDPDRNTSLDRVNDEDNRLA